VADERAEKKGRREGVRQVHYSESKAKNRDEEKKR